MSSNMKSIKEIMRRPQAHWVGDGFNVFPVFADKAFTASLSPFLMFDYAAPKHFPPNNGKPKGVGQHPHRGFETVTIAFQGEVEHKDNQGGPGVIGPGDIQWMTAAKGIVHQVSPGHGQAYKKQQLRRPAREPNSVPFVNTAAKHLFTPQPPCSHRRPLCSHVCVVPLCSHIVCQEFHSNAFSKTGGMFEFCQLWVNLPAKHKMDPPRYQPIVSSQVTVSPLFVHDPSTAACTAAPAAAGSVRIISGEFKGVKGPAMTFTPVDMWDIEIKASEKSFEFDIVEGHNAIVFVREGRIDVQGQELRPQDTAVLQRENTKLVIKASEDSKIVVLAGEPIDEPIAARGPFVMNTQQEIMQANNDFHSGRF